jgi:sulfopyruvate decarboxylase TPP-binding subunit
MIDTAGTPQRPAEAAAAIAALVRFAESAAVVTALLQDSNIWAYSK